MICFSCVFRKHGRHKLARFSRMLVNGFTATSRFHSAIIAISWRCCWESDGSKWPSGDFAPQSEQMLQLSQWYGPEIPKSWFNFNLKTRRTFYLREHSVAQDNKYESLDHTAHSKAFCCLSAFDTCNMFCSSSIATCKRACGNTFDSTFQYMMDVLWKETHVSEC